MKRQKELRTLGLGLMIFSIAFMVYKYINNTNGDTSYISLGLLISVVGMFLAQYGAKKEN